jgi:uncharacterized protein (DUF488 family)
MADVVYTIGHSTHSKEKLIEFLSRHEVTAVADVRSQPYSRINPQFNRESLRADLKTAGISYVFLGRELGARAEDRSCYVEGKVQYDVLARTALFQEGLTRIAQDIGTHRIALMCAEKDPLTCHRAILVCRHLAARGVTAQHILADGRIESHDEAVARLLAELGIVERELFRSRDDLIVEAYSRRGQQIAYSEKQPSSEEGVGGANR